MAAGERPHWPESRTSATKRNMLAHQRDKRDVLAGGGEHKHGEHRYGGDGSFMIHLLGSFRVGGWGEQKCFGSLGLLCWCWFGSLLTCQRGSRCAPLPVTKPGSDDTDDLCHRHRRRHAAPRKTGSARRGIPGVNRL